MMCLVFGLGIGGLSFVPLASASPAQPEIPTVNAEVGSCSAVFTVDDGKHKPIYNAKIDLTFRYGFMNLHKVSLEAFTNTNGMARFEGLPNEAKQPLAFDVVSGNRRTTVTDDPGVTCAATFNVVLP